MQLVEQHVIDRRDPRYAVIDEAAFKSKNLYNAANYEYRQAFIHEGRYLNYNEVQKRMQSHEAYKALPAKVSQQILMVLDKNWKGFREGLKAYYEDPSKFLGRPKLPKYKHKTEGRNILIKRKKDGAMMEMPYAPGSPTRLYALLLRLRPLQEGTLMPFSGELVHGAFLSWLRTAAPEVVNWLHDGQKRRLFTCSSLHFSPSMQPHLRAERENIHLPLDPRKIYTVRITLLLGELFPLFYSVLTQFSVSSGEASNLPFIQLGKQLFLLEEIVLTNNDATGWTGFTSLGALVEQAQQKRFGHESSLTLEFASLTSFSRGNKKTGYGASQMMLPLPKFVFASLLRRWEDIVPPELAPVVQRERVETYLEEDGIIIIDYDLTAHYIHFTTHRLRGFVGTCTYQLRGPDEQTGPEAPLTVRQQLYLLALLAFYCGVGHKTTMGLGQVRLST